LLCCRYRSSLIFGAAYALSDARWWRNDGDGDVDILGTAQNADDVAWYANSGTDPITWTKQVIDNNLNGAWAHLPYDLDGDGDMDVLAGGTDAHQVVWYENQSMVAVPEGLPQRHSGIGKVYPNPFNPHTEVTFVLDNDSQVRLTVFDISGREIAVLANGNYPAGTHTVSWQGKDTAGAAMPSGTYLLRMNAGNCNDSRSLALVR